MTIEQIYKCDVCKEIIEHPDFMTELVPGKNSKVILESLQLTPRGNRIYINDLVAKMSVTLYCGLQKHAQELLHIHNECIENEAIRRLSIRLPNSVKNPTTLEIKQVLNSLTTAVNQEIISLKTFADLADNSIDKRHRSGVVSGATLIHAILIDELEKYSNPQLTTGNTNG